MEKLLNTWVIGVLAIVGLQVAGLHYLTRSCNYIELLQSVDWSAFSAAFSLVPYLL